MKVDFARWNHLECMSKLNVALDLIDYFSFFKRTLWFLLATLNSKQHQLDKAHEKLWILNFQGT